MARTRAPSPARLLYNAWVEEQIENYKDELSRDELLRLADQAVRAVEPDPHGQYLLTEILVRDAVDALILQRLELPSFRRWQHLCRNDTTLRPSTRTDGLGEVTDGAA